MGQVNGFRRDNQRIHGPFNFGPTREQILDSAVRRVDIGHLTVTAQLHRVDATSGVEHDADRLAGPGGTVQPGDGVYVRLQPPGMNVAARGGD